MSYGVVNVTVTVPAVGVAPAGAVQIDAPTPTRDVPPAGVFFTVNGVAPSDAHSARFVNVSPFVDVTDATDESFETLHVTDTTTSELATGVNDVDVDVFAVVELNSAPEVGVFSAT